MEENISENNLNIWQLIDHFYPENNELRKILLIHSWQVTKKALQITRKHLELSVNRQLLFEGAMIHDIGIFLTDAPGINCYGEHPYILHGYLGGQLLRNNGLEHLARFCERHTGAGISTNDIESQHLPLPEGQYMPETIEEQIVCYADKFFSKSSIWREKSPEQAYNSLLKFGEEGATRFLKWHQLFK